MSREYDPGLKTSNVSEHIVRVVAMTRRQEI